MSSSDPVAAFARLDTKRKRLVAFVAFYRRRYGTGPSWTQAAHAIGERDHRQYWWLMKTTRPCLRWEHRVRGSLDIAPELLPILTPVIDAATKTSAGLAAYHESTRPAPEWKEPLEHVQPSKAAHPDQGRGPRHRRSDPGPPPRP
jgi:hypothetical protein